MCLHGFIQLVVYQSTSFNKYSLNVDTKISLFNKTIFVAPFVGLQAMVLMAIYTKCIFV